MKKQILLTLSLLTLNAQANLVGHGNYFAAGETRGAFLAHEQAYGQDFNQNGRTSDSILSYVEFESGSVHHTQIPTYQFKVATDGETIVFLQRESHIGEDKTGDGDRLDTILAYYKISTGEVVYTSIVPHRNSGTLESYDVDQNIITFVQKERDFGVDINGDGDQWDRVIRYIDTDSGQVHNTPIVSLHAKVENGIIASRMPHNGMVSVVAYNTQNQELQHIYDSPSFNLSHISAFPDIDNGRMAWATSESHANIDFDGDAQIESGVFGIVAYDLAHESFHYTNILGLGPVQLKGDVLTYKTHEYNLAQDINQDGDLMGDAVTVMHNMNSQTSTYVPGNKRYSLGQYAMMVSEYDFDARRYNISMFETGNNQACSIACDLQDLASYIEGLDSLTSEQKSSLNEDVLAAAQSIDGSMEGYIAAISSMDAAVDYAWTFNAADLVENHMRPLKDALHDLYDEAAINEENHEEKEGQVNPVEILMEMMNATNDSYVMNELNALAQEAQSGQPNMTMVATHLSNIINHLEQDGGQVYVMALQLQASLN